MENVARINLSQAASAMILQNHRRLSVSIFNVKIFALGSFFKGLVAAPTLFSYFVFRTFEAGYWKD
jgi:hypothetical protein